MIKKIAIVPYVTNGRNSQIGHDGRFNILKKKRSTVLKENLQSVIKTKNWKTERKRRLSRWKNHMKVCILQITCGVKCMTFLRMQS